MYLVEYQKSNGDIIYRKRNTLPNYKIGDYTSMGWIIKDIKFQFNCQYYSLKDYHRKKNKYKQYHKIIKKVYLYLLKISKIILFILLFPFYDYIKTLI